MRCFQQRPRSALARNRALRYPAAMRLLHVFCLACVLSACGGAKTRVIGEHEVRWEGERQNARMAIDGQPIRVVWDEVADAYRAPGCDFGPAATLESLAEQVVATSPGSCQPLVQ